MGGRHSVFCSQRFPDHVHSAGNAGQAALLSQLSCAPSVARLAGVSAGADGCVSECAVVRGRQRVACDRDRAVAGLHFLRAESVSPHAAAGAGPTWALAIEEQYYFVWAPVVRWLRRPWMLATVLVAALIASPLIRHANLHWMTPTNTLIHLDGIALGSLLALGMHTRSSSAGARGSRSGWRHLCWVLRRRPPLRAEQRFWIRRWRLASPARWLAADRVHWRAQSVNALLRRDRWPSTGASAMGST